MHVLRRARGRSDARPRVRLPRIDGRRALARGAAPRLAAPVESELRVALVAAIAACLLGSWWIARSNWASRAWLPGLLILPLSLLTTMSLVASREIRIAADGDRQFFLGSGARDWIDRHTESPTLLLDNGSFYWNDYWHQAYWNRHVAGVLAVSPGQSASLPGRIDARVYEDGSIRNQPGRTGSVARIGDVERNYGRRHRTCPTRARRRDQPAGSLECRAAAPAQVPHQGNATPANVEWSFEIDVFDCRRNGLRVLIRGSTAPAIVRYTGGAPALEERVVAGRRWTPIWVALRRQPGTRLCVAHFEPASMVDIGTIAHVGAIGLAAAEVAGAQSP